MLVKGYSIECAAIVDGQVFEELGSAEPKVTHWAPWPVLGVAAVV